MCGISGSKSYVCIKSVSALVYKVKEGCPLSLESLLLQGPHHHMGVSGWVDFFLVSGGDEARAGSGSLLPCFTDQASHRASPDPEDGSRPSTGVGPHHTQRDRAGELLW